MHKRFNVTELRAENQLTLLEELIG